MNKICLTLFISSFFCCGSVYAAPDQWCSKGGQSYEVHLFGQSFRTDNQKRHAQGEIETLFKSLRGGDRLIVYSHDNQGYSKTFDSCVAECVKDGLDAILSTDCSAMVASREKLVFKRNLAGLLRKEFSSQGTDYDIYRGIQSLFDAHKNSPDVKSKVIGAISMVPVGADPEDPKSLNNEFVKATQKRVIPTGFPRVEYIGRVRTSALDKFWMRLFEINGYKYE